MVDVSWLRILLLVVLAAGCEQPDPAQIVQPLEATLGAAVPAAYFAAVSMAALGGRPSPCATVVTPAASGGDVRVEVSLGPGCPQMFGADELGTTVVTGVWTPQLATFVMDFTGVSSDGHPLLVEGLASMTVVPTDATHLVVAYGEEDIEVGTTRLPAAGVQQVAWVVDVDTAGTDEPSDDSISVSGGSQSLFALGGTTSGGDVTQVAVGDAVFNAGCRRNPNSGIAAVQRAGTSGGGWVLFHFHDACDGNADVAAALAPYELLITDSLPLAFLQQ
jgi:hypothetical protein